LRAPLRVYLFSFEASSGWDSTWNEGQVRHLIGEVNAIWRPAGISWTLQSVLPTAIDRNLIPARALLQTGPEFRQHLVQMSPIVPEVVGRRLWRVAILRTFPILAGGAYLPRTRTAFFCQETRRGETTPIVLAHELGHSLGLMHVPEAANLMHPAAGARGNAQVAIGLNPEQVAQARDQVEYGPKGFKEGRRVLLM
jgi:hypothetical protein